MADNRPKCKQSPPEKCSQRIETQALKAGDILLGSSCQLEHLHLAQDCVVPVEYSFKQCGHVKSCGDDETKLRSEAKVPCKHTLSCGHPCEGYCGDTCDTSKCKVCAQKCEIERQKQCEAEERIREEARHKAKKELEDFIKNNPKIDEGCHYHELSQIGVEFFNVHTLFQKYIQPGNNWFPHVTKIEKVTNLKLEKEWLEAKSIMFEPTNSALKFHGTDGGGVEGIAAQGFKLPKKSYMFGAGVFFANDSSKSAQNIYTKGSNKLLLCDVLLGKSLTVEKACIHMTQQDLRISQCDSLYTGRETDGQHGMRSDGYVIYNPAQALPKYIIHYKQCTLDKIYLSMFVPSSSTDSSNFQVRRLWPPGQIDLRNEEDFYFHLAESQVIRVQRQHQISYMVTSIDHYQTQQLIVKFKQKHQDFKSRYGGSKEGKPIFAFHDTKSENIESIMKSNFDTSKFKSGTGNDVGIYFSEFPDIKIRSVGGTHKLILCYLLPGLSYVCPSLMMNAPLQQGFDSHRVGADRNGRGQELVIFNEDQILPTFVINF